MLSKIRKIKTIATIGGTFDTLHRGHKEYIRLAFAHADYVLIYVTSDEYARNLKNYHVRARELRIRNLHAFLKGFGILSERYDTREIKALDQLTDELANANINLSIIAPEYLNLFDDINLKRTENCKMGIEVWIKPRTRDTQNNGSAKVLTNHLPV